MFKDSHEGETHSYPIITQAFAVTIQDEFGLTIQTVDTKEHSDELFKTLKKQYGQ